MVCEVSVVSAVECLLWSSGDQVPRLGQQPVDRQHLRQRREHDIVAVRLWSVGRGVCACKAGVRVLVSECRVTQESAAQQQPAVG